MYTLYSFSCCLKYVNAKFCSVLIYIEILQHNKQVKFLWVFLLFSVVLLFWFFFTTHHASQLRLDLLKCSSVYSTIKISECKTHSISAWLFPPFFP